MQVFFCVGALQSAGVLQAHLTAASRLTGLDARSAPLSPMSVRSGTTSTRAQQGERSIGLAIMTFQMLMYLCLCTGGHGHMGVWGTP